MSIFLFILATFDRWLKWKWFPFCSICVAEIKGALRKLNMQTRMLFKIECWNYYSQCKFQLRTKIDAQSYDDKLDNRMIRMSDDRIYDCDNVRKHIQKVLIRGNRHTENQLECENFDLKFSTQSFFRVMMMIYMITHVSTGIERIDYKSISTIFKMNNGMLILLCVFFLVMDKDFSLHKIFPFYERKCFKRKFKHCTHKYTLTTWYFSLKNPHRIKMQLNWKISYFKILFTFCGDTIKTLYTLYIHCVERNTMYTAFNIFVDEFMRYMKGVQKYQFKIETSRSCE